MEHLRSGQPEKYPNKNERDKNTPIHRAMRKYGVDNFKLEIIENCSIEELDEKEKFYISLFKSNDREFGYNLSNGGQKTFGLKGERHSQAKLTQEEVNEIKFLLKTTTLNSREIIAKYPKVKSTDLISQINTGRIWYDEKEKYPLRPTYYGSPGTKNPSAKFSKEQIIAIRKKYKNGAIINQLAKEYGVNFRTIKNIVNYISYKDIKEEEE